MVDGRKNNGSREGLARARARKLEYIRIGKSLQEGADDSDEDAIFTLDDLKNMENDDDTITVKPKKEKEIKDDIDNSPEPEKPVEPVKKEDPYKQMFESLQNEMNQLKEHVNRPKEPPQVRTVQKTRQQIIAEQLRSKMWDSFN